MVSRATTLLFALLFLAALVGGCRAFEVRSCDAEREACLQKCGQSTSTVDFDCDDSGDGQARAFSCACASGEWTETLAPTGSAGDPAGAVVDSSSQDLAYCVTERAKCIDLCGRSNAVQPDFQCQEERSGSSSALASSCACANVTETLAPAAERPAGSADPLTSSCSERRAQCEQSCPAGYVPDFKCDSDGSSGEPGSFSIASACSCVEDTEGTLLGGNADGIQTAESAAYEAGYRAGAKFVAGYLLSSLALVQAVVGED